MPKNIVITKRNKAYHDFFKDDETLSFRQAIYSCGKLLYTNVGHFGNQGDPIPCHLYSFDVVHKEFVYAALYEAKLKNKNIILKFIKITGEECIRY